MGAGRFDVFAMHGMAHALAARPTNSGSGGKDAKADCLFILARFSLSLHHNRKDEATVLITRYSTLIL
jgi:hypothetical protein